MKCCWTAILIFCFCHQYFVHAKFVVPAGSSGSCAYEIFHDRNRVNYTDAKQACIDKDASLAMFKNETQRNEVFSLIKSIYPGEQALFFWLGGERDSAGVSRWLDKTPLQFWVRDRDGSRLMIPVEDYLSMTSYRSTSIVTSDLFISHSQQTSNRGYPCEKLVRGRPCDSSPCSNGGTCTDVGCSYACQCPEGVLNPCSSMPCENGGTCERVGCSNDYICRCPRSRTGRNCRTCAYDPCSRVNCQNGGTCQPKYECSNDYVCRCPPGRTGEHCEECVHNPCSFAPCRNGGICEQNGCSNEYSCRCPTSRIGRNCETCAYDPCSRAKCQNGGTCQPRYECSNNYVCRCPPGRVGAHCEECSYRPCGSDPCRNGGTCQPAKGCENSYTCNCWQFFSGPDCNYAQFLPSSPQQGLCIYHVSIPNIRYYKLNSQSRCMRFGSSLAMVKNITQQEDITKLIFNVYGKTTWINLFLGTNLLEFSHNNFTWLDGTSIQTSSINGYPNWNSGQINTQSGNGWLTLTKQFSSSMSTSLYWRSVPQYTQSGLICEKFASGSPCDSKPCKNGGTCRVVGCSYSCKCLGKYKGRNCNFIPPRLKSATPASDFFNNSFTLICLIEGNPQPSVQWKVNNGKKNKDEYENLSNSTGSPFFVQTSLKGNLLESRLSMVAGGLCLGRINISCWARNEVMEEHKLHEFKLNKPSYKPHEENYFVLSRNEQVITADDASIMCQGLGGNLAHIADNSTQEFLAKILNTRVNKSKWFTADAWIGLRVTENGESVWPNQKVASYTNWEQNEPRISPSCAYISTNNTWKTERCSSNETNFRAHYICIKTGREIPNIINVTSPLCGNGNSSELQIRWKPFATMKSVNHSIEIKKRSKTVQTIIVNPGAAESNRGIFTHHLFNTAPREKYVIEIMAAPAFCRKEILSSWTIVTGYVKPGPVKSSTLNKALDNTCFVTWEWPSSTNHTINNFIIRVKKHPHVNKNNTEVVSAIEEENLLLSVTSKSRSVSFEALPNRVHEVEVYAQSCAGNGSFAKSIGTCVAPVAGPVLLSAPSVLNNSSGGIILSIASALEVNGPISCYFLIAMYDVSSKEQQSSFSLDQLLANASSQNLTEPVSETPYIALAISSSQSNTVEIVMGDERNSSCDVNRASSGSILSSRKRRTVDQKEYKGSNFPLLPNKSYSVYVISSTPTSDGLALYVASNITQFTTAPIKTEATSAQGTAELLQIIAPIICLLVIGILIAAFVFQSKRKSKDIKEDSTAMTFQPDQDSENATYENVHFHGKSSAPIMLANLLETYQALMENKSKLLAEEFQTIKDTSRSKRSTTEIGKLETNKTLNRYKNILPSDHARVILEKGDGNSEEIEYINASYINSYNSPQLFIATQGPLDATIPHFWTMIWQKNCQVIVMLAQIMENGKKKCAKYWPEKGSSFDTNDFAIKTTEEIANGCYVIRMLEITSKTIKHAVPKVVTQFQYKKWPDHGVPLTTTGLIRLYGDVIAEYNTSEVGPIVVHCSAGAGRTGTFIAIDNLVRARDANCESIDVFKVVMDMRRNRNDMVQNQQQYILIHKVIAEIYFFGETDYTADMFANAMENMEKITSDEFGMMDVIPPLNASCEFGSQDVYRDQNRMKHNIPYDSSRVTLSSDGQSEVFPYINASFVDMHSGSNKMIVAQGPMTNTVQNFWKMITEWNVKIVVMLTPLTENNQEMCCCYWPTGPAGSHMSAGRVHIQLVDESEMNQLLVRKLDATFDNFTMRVTQIQYKEWLSSGEQPAADEILQVINAVKKLNNETADGNILVHCSDGLRQSGVFCAVFNLIERYNAEQKIDVFRAVKDLRDMRPGMVPSLELYRLCYKTMKYHLATFALYDNFR